MCLCVTRLKGDLAEHHPDVSKVKAAAEGLGGAAVQRHRHVAGARVPVVQHRLECHRLRLPTRNEAGLKPAGDGGEDLHPAGEHVVTVDLDEKDGGVVGLSWCHVTSYPAAVGSCKSLNLHRGEVSLPVEDELHLYVALSAQ